MICRAHLQAARDALSRARDADERLLAALAEARVWLTLAVTDDDTTDEHAMTDGHTVDPERTHWPN